MIDAHHSGVLRIATPKGLYRDTAPSKPREVGLDPQAMRVMAAWQGERSKLSPGDYLVHADHGIGTFRGLMELVAGRITSELLCIEYLGGDRLFLPVHRLNLVHRYGAADAATPRLDRLGGQSWERLCEGAAPSRPLERIVGAQAPE